MFRLEVIDYFDQTGQNLVARVPANGTAAIQYGAQLIVQQNQEAIFFRDGRAMDTFGAGRYTLTTANIPILSKILTAPWEKSPFQACVYFVGKQRFIDQRWGTRQPITMRDPDFGLVRLRGFGKYSFRVIDSTLLINEIVGTQGRLTTEEVSNYLRDIVVSGLSDLLATINIGLLQMTARFDELAAATRMKLDEQFAKFGLELTDFMINSISPPEEVQKAIDARTSMSAIGDLRTYTVYQAAKGLGNAGSADGNSAAALGMGAGLGMMFPPLIQQALQQTPAPANAPSPPASHNPALPQPAAPTLDFSALNKTPSNSNNCRDTIRQISKSANWQLTDSDEKQWRITVPIGSLRKQVVHVDFGQKDDAGHSIISIWSSCGQLQPQNALALLRYNAQLIHGAFAVQKVDETELLVMRENLLADTADSLELSKSITSIAWQADRVEEQTLGSDHS